MEENEEKKDTKNEILGRIKEVREDIASLHQSLQETVSQLSSDLEHNLETIESEFEKEMTSSLTENTNTLREHIGNSLQPLQQELENVEELMEDNKGEVLHTLDSIAEELQKEIHATQGKVREPIMKKIETMEQRVKDLSSSVSSDFFITKPVGDEENEERLVSSDSLRVGEEYYFYYRKRQVGENNRNVTLSFVGEGIGGFFQNKDELEMKDVGNFLRTEEGVQIINGFGGAVSNFPSRWAFLRRKSRGQLKIEIDGRVDFRHHITIQRRRYAIISSILLGVVPFVFLQFLSLRFGGLTQILIRFGGAIYVLLYSLLGLHH